MQVRPLTAPNLPEDAASPVRLWPLWNLEPQPAMRPDLEPLGAPARSGMMSLPWPLVTYQWHTDADGRRASFWGLHPIVSRLTYPNRAEGDTQSTVTDVVFPIVQRQDKTVPGSTRSKTIVMPLWLSSWKEAVVAEGRAERYRSFLFPLWWQGSDTLELRDKPAQRKEYSYLIPFWWYNSGLSHDFPFFNPTGKKVAALWPFFGRWEDWNEGKDFTFYLWPLVVWGVPRDGDSHRSLSILWPFLRFQWAGEKNLTSEVRLWPIFGWADRGEAYSRYFLYPLFLLRNADDPKDAAKRDNNLLVFPFWFHSQKDDTEFLLYFPFTGYAKLPNKSYRFIFLPFYLQWEDREEGFIETRWLLFLYRHRRTTDGDAKDNRTNILLLYDDEEVEDASPTAEKGKELNNRQDYRLLFYATSSLVKPTYTFRGNYFFFLWAFKTREHDDGFVEWSRMINPFAFWKGDSDGTYHLRAIWPIWQEALDGFQRNWTPIWTFYTRDIDLLRRPVSTKERPVEDRFRQMEKADDYPKRGEVLGRVEDRRVLGWLYRDHDEPGLSETHVNLLLFSYDRYNDRRAVSLLGGWFPITWGEEAPIEAWELPAEATTSIEPDDEMTTRPSGVTLGKEEDEVRRDQAAPFRP